MCLQACTWTIYYDGIDGEITWMSVECQYINNNSSEPKKKKETWKMRRAKNTLKVSY